MAAVKGDGGLFEGVGGLLGVHLDETDEVVYTGGERTVSDDIIAAGLHGGCFESEDGLLTEGCSPGVSKGG